MEEPLTTLLQLGGIARRYDTDMAHALLTAIAVAYYEGSSYGWLQ